MEHKIKAVLRRLQHVISYIVWENGGPEMEPRNDIQDRLIIGGNLECRYVDEARNKKFLIEGGWRLIVSGRWSRVTGRICVQDEVVEWLDSQPGGVGWPLAIGLRR